MRVLVCALMPLVQASRALWLGCREEHLLVRTGFFVKRMPMHVVNIWEH